MYRNLLALAAALVVSASPAHAITYAWSGDTTGAPVFDRPFFDFSGLSSSGQGVRYQTLTFSVTAAGSYDFLSATTGWDNFLLLYSPSFSPSAPLVNGVVANDDLGPLTSGFSRDLVTGTTYVAVTTGFSSSDFGTYANTINGPGNVVAGVVPEPTTAALLAFGVFAFAACSAFRRSGTRGCARWH